MQTIIRWTIAALTATAVCGFILSPVVAKTVDVTRHIKATATQKNGTATNAIADHSLRVSSNINGFNPVRHSVGGTGGNAAGGVRGETPAVGTVGDSTKHALTNTGGISFDFDPSPYCPNFY